MADVYDSRNNQFQFTSGQMRTKSNTLSSKCHLSSIAFTTFAFFFFYLVLYVSVRLGLKQHINGPMVYWPTIMANTSTNNTSAENGEVVVLQVNEHNHHSWRYNILILRAWLGSCLALGLLIGLILIVLIWSFLWKKYHVPFKRYFGVKSQDCKKDYDQRQFEMQDIETQACFLENTVH